MPSESIFPSVPGVVGEVLQGRVVFDQTDRDIFIFGTKIRVVYILDLLISGLTKQQIIDEHQGLSNEDIEACLLVSTGKYTVKKGSNPIQRPDSVEVPGSFASMVRLFPYHAAKPPVLYKLPSRLIPQNAIESMDAWTRNLIGKDLPHLVQILERRWDSIKSSPLKLIKDLIIHANPKFLVLHDGCDWLRCERGENDDRNVFLIPAPGDKNLIDRYLDNSPFREHMLLREFYHCFLGLKELMPNYACEFELPMVSFQQNYGEDCLLPSFQEWNCAMPIYRTAGGDVLLIHPSGKLGWFMHELMTIGQEFQDFGSFLEAYIAYKTLNVGPLEAFS